MLKYTSEIVFLRRKTKVTNDFYCDEVLSGKTQVEKIYETEHTLVYYHTKPFYQIH